MQDKIEKIKLHKNGAHVHMEKSYPSGMYIVMLRTPSGATHDKVRCDDYRTACAFYKLFNAIAKSL